MTHTFNQKFNKNNEHYSQVIDNSISLFKKKNSHIYSLFIHTKDQLIYKKERDTSKNGQESKLHMIEHIWKNVRAYNLEQNTHTLYWNLSFNMYTHIYIIIIVVVT